MGFAPGKSISATGAYFTTGIPNIEVYIGMPQARIAALRRLNRLGGLLRLGVFQRLLKSLIGAGGPDEAERAGSRTRVWGEVQAPSGETRSARIEVGNGYDFTVRSAIGALQFMLEYTGETGYRTPSQLLGADFVEHQQGSGSIRVTKGRAWESRPS